MKFNYFTKKMKKVKSGGRLSQAQACSERRALLDRRRLKHLCLFRIFRANSQIFAMKWGDSWNFIVNIILHYYLYYCSRHLSFK